MLRQRNYEGMEGMVVLHKGAVMRNSIVIGLIFAAVAGRVSYADKLCPTQHPTFPGCAVLVPPLDKFPPQPIPDDAFMRRCIVLPIPNKPGVCAWNDPDFLEHLKALMEANRAL
jgi:hypothetical protein